MICPSNGSLIRCHRQQCLRVPIALIFGNKLRDVGLQHFMKAFQHAVSSWTVQNLVDLPPLQKVREWVARLVLFLGHSEFCPEVEPVEELIYDCRCAVISQRVCLGKFVKWSVKITRRNCATWDDYPRCQSRHVPMVLRQSCVKVLLTWLLTTMVACTLIAATNFATNVSLPPTPVGASLNLGLRAFDTKMITCHHGLPNPSQRTCALKRWNLM